MQAQTQEQSWLKLEEAAGRLGVSRVTTWRLARRGFLTTQDVPGAKRMWILASDVEELKARSVTHRRAFL